MTKPKQTNESSIVPQKNGATAEPNKERKLQEYYEKFQASLLAPQYQPTFRAYLQLPRSLTTLIQKGRAGKQCSSTVCCGAGPK